MESGGGHYAVPAFGDNFPRVRAKNQWDHRAAHPSRA
jgi:hypothetical protein